ncbi:hypothetical protein GLOIN_2v1597984 [Rhizophagus irregularis DAOM 181602=DAOM 197198]|uniref:Uncharacterized protein n=1 Tax=Rhizophagus irregularis (strain DAOM 181602 / DAOM 197198 / MUCL 43194) TaxID=747089 RepID=A0A2P4Q3U8_RHIID|nr:hypothetical protein GLOIN_2v1597984 [Rhizophagus irregularis DAOM 181602=DAOM 197198]POG72252.1 hypothetical protein GLOIN_2v1597984 [Rhizophagus irregularis DAOM 181602=DAOM 197198]GET64464.1 hypothetical protein GLOIN_2v1597984 [Rhizophagus irregularis DAOM 181602=DAOM 197198]|eukprot:XP_025179118.1 hypothetical protein GLOIN_2v1597984 [Rhizophagus irregularis DAOM 181602=DAOM 197198]
MADRCIVSFLCLSINLFVNLSIFSSFYDVGRHILCSFAAPPAVSLVIRLFGLLRRLFLHTWNVLFLHQP